ncbi:cholecystokinin receptor type A-like [Branchiostoma floridae]|uniref:Cholecystokinin receptor type A-like n=1 Tax=Branchiostoma floridae TaxID=7739 RepID=A0A9J7MAP2_BRAFL|nr:cholecystokinin receptor type A-like [Branchiostoma floridae]
MADNCSTTLPLFPTFGVGPFNLTSFGSANLTGFGATIFNVTLLLNFTTVSNLSNHYELSKQLWEIKTAYVNTTNGTSDISDILDLLNQVTNTLECLDNVREHLKEAAYTIALPIIIILGVISVLGIAGNTIVLVVYKREKRVCSNVFILTLALVDIAMCLIAIPLELNNFLQWTKEGSDWSCKFSVYFVQTSLVCSILTLAAVAMDRYFAICRPFRKTMTVKRAKLTALGIVVLGLVLDCPILFVYGVDKFVPDQNGHQFGTCKVLDQYANEVAVSIFLSANFVVFVVCSVAIVVLYMLVFCKVLNHHKKVHPTLFRNASGSRETNPIPKSNSMQLRERPNEITSQVEPNTDHSTPSVDFEKQKKCRTRRSLSDPAITNLAVAKSRLRTFRATRAKKTRPVSPVDRSEDSGHETDGQETKSCRSSPVMRSDGGYTSAASSYRRRLVTRARSRYKNPRMSSPHVQTAKMLALATLVFILTWLPHWILTFVYSDPATNSPFISQAAQAIFLVLDRLYLLNSVLNPVIYSFASRSFRIALKNTVMCKRQRHQWQR